MRLFPLLVGLIATIGCATVPLVENTDTQFINQEATLVADRDLTFFEQAALESPHRLDYSFWNETLDKIVVEVIPPANRSLFGARGVRLSPGLGSSSPSADTTILRDKIRLEGNRIDYSIYDESFGETVGNYRRSLEAISYNIEFSKLDRKEQLAYWLNLSNAFTVEILAKNYPIKTTEQLTIGGISFDEAKLLTVSGVRLSLKDIREKIVYEYWGDADTIYGFYRGDVGGPQIPTRAYTGSNVEEILEESAREYVNSLRGVQSLGKTTRISNIYFDAPTIFPRWPDDIRRHLYKYAEDDVAKILDKNLPFEKGNYDTRLADLDGAALEK